jgi:hypothetical protein
MSDMETRQEMLAAAARHEQELEQALVDLKQAVQHPFAIRERIAENPLPWLVGGLLIGLWLGSRNGRG